MFIGPNMNNDITNMIEKCEDCALAAKAPRLLSHLGSKQNHLGREIHVDFTGPLEDFYYLIVLDSYSKCPEVLRCRRHTTGTTIGFLHELFCAVRCSRLCGQWQRKPIHIRRIQGLLRNLPNKAHNHTAISPKIQRPGWTFCRHVKFSPYGLVLRWY